ncbi:MAG: hypothetical protein LPK02_12770 [Rhodobacterales bacterium]|nr:hypothetical protein [Rhodobacterales bacterium]
MKQFVFQVVALVLFVLIFTHEYIFASHVETATIIQVGAPEICSTGSNSRIFPHEPYRSARPELAVFGYCGAVETDRGIYKLPDMNFLLFSFDTSRPKLHAMLRPGCRYRMLIVGYGGRYQGGDGARVPLRQHISRILEAYPCE